MNEPTPEWRKAFDEWKNALDRVRYVQVYSGADTGFLAGWLARGAADADIALRWDIKATYDKIRALDLTSRPESWKGETP